MKYRPDVDGLRAVAVGSVVAYHLGIHVRGGFVGVDVFFVISGFLITGLISARLEAGTFTIVDFYRRRLRRILPALWAMLAVTTAASSVLLFQQDLKPFASSLVATGLFGSNVYFERHYDYFTAGSAPQPLLHTWSLGVEEQFYLVWPLLLMVLATVLPHRRTAFLWAVTGASFVLNLVQIRTNPTADFYLLPSRAWELGLGGLLAVGAVPPLRSRLASHVVGSAGLLAIAAACVLNSASKPYPGANAVLPVLGAVAVIWTGQTSVAGTLLAWRPVVFVGLVSYSWYLWHWPVIVLYESAALTTPRGLAVPGLALGSFAIAYVFHRLVETPLRHVPLPRGRSVVAFALASVAVVTVVGLVLPGVVRTVQPEDPRVAQLLAGADSDALAEADRKHVCFLTQGDQDSDFRTSECLTPDPTRPNVLVVGDSHAAVIWRAIADGAPGMNVMQATAAGCFPLLPVTGQAWCTHVISTAYDGLDALDLDTVVVTARWDDGAVDADLAATVTELRKHARHVIVVGPSQEYTAQLPVLLARAVISGDRGLAQEHLVTGIFSFDGRVKAVTEKAGGEFVSLTDHLCPGGVCRELTDDGLPVLVDTDHFSAAGAVVAVTPVLAALASS